MIVMAGRMAWPSSTAGYLVCAIAAVASSAAMAVTPNIACLRMLFSPEVAATAPSRGLLRFGDGPCGSFLSQGLVDRGTEAREGRQQRQQAADGDQPQHSQHLRPADLDRHREARPFLDQPSG